MDRATEINLALDGLAALLRLAIAATKAAAQSAELTPEQEQALDSRIASFRDGTNPAWNVDPNPGS